MPTEWEWQAVADYDGSFNYGCGVDIDNSRANYLGSVHPDGTTVVGSFGTYGYRMCDLAGNVFEWTNSAVSSGNYVLRGGVWRLNDSFCLVTYRDSNDAPDNRSNNDGFRVCRDADMVWVPIDDPGVSGHEGFNGQMSRYETTNAQYCQFLNEAIRSGDIVVDANDVVGASGSNSGADFVGQAYYNLTGAGYTDDGAVNGGAARINYSGDVFTVDPGFENHPVTYVTWYGATAFCNYYGWRLPTEWEWQAVADYDGTFTYGCGTTINNSMANYQGSIHPDGTTVAGSFGTYGYGMCDMAGNAWEWTSTWTSTGSGDYFIVRGGCWLFDDSICTVSYQGIGSPEFTTYYHVGFRVCRNVEPSGMNWVSISDPGVPEHEPFNGQMSKYETTNAQYCQFLNEALASGDVSVTGDIVYGANGTNPGEDFDGQVYYDLAGPGNTYNGATNGGAARINYSGGVFSIDSGFENHPVTHVSWYGATAFCNYYGFRLPTEWEWQAVADYDGSYIYGCGTTIDNSIANYYGSIHPDGTTIVGSFGDPLGYGYGMCDMAGNVFEWTSSTVSDGNYVLRGGVWRLGSSYCRVDYRSSNDAPNNRSNNDGFRVCR